jgi:hypothetical protein
MVSSWVIAAGISTAVLVLLGLVFFLGRRLLHQAQRLFSLQRRLVQEEFILAATATGKPRGLRWKACEWGPAETTPPTFARDRATGAIVALLPVTIQFEAVEGSDMEGLPAVGNLRNASAVFLFDGRNWRPTGRAVFNLNPDEALARLTNQFAPLEG